ncbi:hypothetical protein Patl_1304 [Paraglaciecola sp. T6c]|uniref:hypothetical protein n=1 Tax=Pseudoalteromonas atlantica (strain T6c / ATCC BAA-1087) TaxID=3042615 RepID=UPI00005C6C62|nr:hypothetical protein [Paraglaciecola sp. T6c]ABG39830.1 hypothetical protein Patl_1304 [Paraglaciecola sp. T6c]
MKRISSCIRHFTLFCLLNIVVIDAFGISITARRLYLDPKSDSTNIRVLNMDAEAQRCTVQVRDVLINEKGLIELAANGTTTENSAKPLIRLAPRRFDLGMREHQMVKLLYRRKPGIKNGEYQGVLAIKCIAKKRSNDEAVNIDAALVHNVPVIVRTGRLPLQAEFTSSNIQGDHLQLELTITGNRSLTGNLEVIDRSSGDVVYKRKDLSIYSQQPKKPLDVPLGEYRDSPLLLKFTENANFGGDLVIQKQID